MVNLKDILHEDLVKMFNMLQEFLEYLNVEKSKVEELDNARRAKQANRGS